MSRFPQAKGPPVPPPSALPWETVIFLADVFDVHASSHPHHLRPDLEQILPHELDIVMAALKSIHQDVRHYDNLGRLAQDASGFPSAVLFSTYGGPPTRNRLILPPAFAELACLDYVGLDAMGHAICHDKTLTKHLARDCGLATPEWRLLSDSEDLILCREFPVPYVLKPVSEGSSIGISNSGLITDPAAGEAVAYQLLHTFSQPVLMEAFAPGHEVSLVAIERPEDPPYAALVEIQVAGQPDYFDTHLFDAEEKQTRSLSRSVCPHPTPLSDDDSAAIQRLLKALGHFGYIRIDGKMKNGQFAFLEATPDAWLLPAGQFAQGFLSAGWTYEQVLREVIATAALRTQGRYAND